MSKKTERERGLSETETRTLELLVRAYGWTRLCKLLHVGDSSMFKALNHRTMRADTLRKFRRFIHEEN